MPSAAFRALSIVAAVVALAGCKTSPAPDKPRFRPVATVGEIMHDIVIPHAEVVWDSVGTVVTAEGTEETAPRTEADWYAVESSATTLMEAGNLLLIEGRVQDTGDWEDWALALSVAAESVRKAARDRDPEAVFMRGGDLFEACQGCHFSYRFEDDPKTIHTH